MVVILSNFPEGGAGKGVQLAAGGTRREDPTVDPNVTLQNAGEHLFLINKVKKIILDYLTGRTYIHIVGYKT